MPCAHYYHTECIKAWLLNHRACPICREVVPQPGRARLGVPDEIVPNDDIDHDEELARQYYEDYLSGLTPAEFEQLTQTREQWQANWEGWAPLRARQLERLEQERQMQRQTQETRRTANIIRGELRRNGFRADCGICCVFKNTLNVLWYVGFVLVGYLLTTQNWLDWSTEHGGVVPIHMILIFGFLFLAYPLTFQIVNAIQRRR